MRARLTQKLFQINAILGWRYLVLILAVGFLVILGAFLVNDSIRHRLVNNVLENQRQEHAATVARIDRVLLRAEKSITRFSQLITCHSRDLQQEQEPLAAILRRETDGVWRSGYAGFDPATEAAIWLAPTEHPERVNAGFFMRTRRITTLYGLGSLNEFFVNTWVLPNINSEVIFFPDQGAFLSSVTPDLDYRETPWFRLADPANNPDGRPRWTPPLYDPPSKAWLISVVAPFHLDGVWAGSVGHDVHLSTLIQALLNERSGAPMSKASPFYVVTNAGEILASQAGVVSHPMELPASLRSRLHQPTPAPGEMRMTKDGRTFLLESAIPSLSSRVFYLLPEDDLLHDIREDVLILQWINTAVFALLLVFLLRNLIGIYQSRLELIHRNEQLEVAVEARTEELRLATIRLEELTLMDSLTGLGNRRCFDQSLSRLWSSAQRGGLSIALLMIDVDYFKRYNDHLGHQAGDACLIRIAQVIQAVACRSEDIATRYGGEEFAVILAGSEMEGAMIVAARLIAAMADAAVEHPAGVTEWVTLSLGVACCRPKPGMKQEVLVRESDLALYRAKSDGRNRYVTASSAEQDRCVDG